MPRTHMGKTSEPTTLTLLERASGGDQEAIDLLFGRYVRPLNRWATGRLPLAIRDLADTQDMVQDVMLKTLRHVDSFEHRGTGSFLAYLRRAVLNRINEEFRRKAKRPEREPLDSQIPSGGESPVEHAIGSETLARYEHALECLSPIDREAIIARVELGLSHSEIAELLGKSSADAARMAVARALARLADLMNTR
jgi:RNA polymerase sigma-70 factor, ECF subfamily